MTAKKPTLAQQRQAIRNGMTASRGTGAQMQESRRAIGDSMIEQRTGRSVADDINRLTNTQPARKTLRRIEPVGALPPARGRGVYKAPPATAGGGIASPLVENVISSGGKLVPNREYWPAGLTSSDGLFVLPAIKTLNLTDAEGAAVQISLANPEGAVE